MIELAEVTAGEITHPADQTRALAAVAKAMSAAGQWDDAEEVAWGITAPDRQREALGTVVRTMGKVDRPRALALAAEVEEAGSAAERYERDDVLAAVAEALGAVGQWDRAEQATRDIAHAFARDEALGVLTQALVGAGEWDRAERVARGTADTEKQVRALAAVATALVAVDLDRALAVAGQAEDTPRTIPNLYERAKAWAVIVERLMAAATWPRPSDDPFDQRLRRLLAEILAGERWLDALEPLGKLDPAALAAVDRELHA